MANAAESCSFLLVLSVQSICHYYRTYLTDEIQSILHNDECKEPETLINEQILRHNRPVFWPLLSCCLLLFPRRFIKEVEGTSKATLNIVSTAGAASLFEAVVLESDEPDKTHKVHQKDEWPRTIIHIVFGLYTIDQHLE